MLIPFITNWEAGKTTPYHNALRTGVQTSGTLAEFTVQPENTLVRTPQNLTDEEDTSLSVAGKKNKSSKTLELMKLSIIKTFLIGAMK